jgi:hypothetical protein
MNKTRRRGLFGVVAAGVIVLSAVVVFAVGRGAHSPVPPIACVFSSSTTTGGYSLTPLQAQNASIIAAVALRKGMPDHAVTVALAASLQETQLRNLPYGDLDSLGLFQQRPSQGWGTPAQIMDPNFSTSAFYDHLVQVNGWQTIAVTQAAQLVQRSATPTAYAQWENEARSLARTLTGEVTAGLSCHLDGFGGPAPAQSALAQAASTEMGAQLLGVPVSSKTGWQVATWAVAHAYQYHLHSVSFGSMEWTAASGTWQPSAGSPAGTSQSSVTVT